MAAEKEAVNNEKTGPKLARHRKDEQHEQNEETEENELKPARANTYRS